MKTKYYASLFLLCLILTGCDFLKSFFGKAEPPAPPAPPTPPPVVKNIPKPEPKPEPKNMEFVEPEPIVANPWHEILGPAQGELPEPRPVLNWGNDLQFALSEAVSEGRPILVSVSCEQPEFEQWAEMQKRLYEPTPELSQLLQQFVTVKLTDPRNMNLNMLPMWKYQDPDNSWWVYLLSDSGAIYSVFGGRDHRSDFHRTTIEGLMAAMRRVLNHHYDPRRLEWNIDGPTPVPQTLRPENVPAFRQWSRIAKGGVTPPTLNFHEIYDVLYHEKFINTNGKFSQKWIWPYPENIGLEMDPRDTLVVKNVAPGSVADQAGIVPGDVLGAAQNKRLFTETDLRVQLHQSSVDLELYWVSQGQVRNAQLIPPENWKQTDLSWRLTSLYNIHGGPIPGFIIVPVENSVRSALKIPPPFLAGYIIAKKGTAAYDKWGMGVRDLILVEINNKPIPNMPPSTFLAWFRTNFTHGQRLSYGVIGKNGKHIVISNDVRTQEYAPYNISARDSIH